MTLNCTLAALDPEIREAPQTAHPKRFPNASKKVIWSIFSKKDYFL